MSLAIKAARMTSQGSGRVMPGIGDPGLFGFIGKALGTVGKIAGKILPGPIGAVAGGVGGLLAGRATAPQVSPRIATPGISSVAVQRALQERTGRTVIDPRAILPGGRPFITTMDANGAGPAPSGFHWNKSDYFLKDGTFVEKGTKLVKNRRRNSLNPRALDRAIGRVSGAKKASKKLGRITIRSSCPAKR